MKNTTLEPGKKILVIGATGKTGRRVLRRLVDRGIPTLGVTHATEPRFDWSDTTTWGRALDNIEAVYISYYPDVALPRAPEAIKEFTELAVNKGIQKLVLLSGRGEEAAQQCEEILMKSGADWTIVRASWFCQNFSEGSFLEPLLAGHVALPAGDVGEPFVDVDDIADVVVEALTKDGHNGKVYEVTGPRLLTFEQAIQEIAQATGRPIQFQQVPVDVYESALKEYGLPKEIIWLITYLFTEVFDGRNAKITEGVQQALGRKPTDFSEYVRKTVATGIWSKQPVM